MDAGNTADGAWAVRDGGRLRAVVAVNRTIVERQRNSVVPRHNRAGKLQLEAATCAFVGEAKLLARPVADSEFQVGPPYCPLAIRGPDSVADTAELR